MSITEQKRYAPEHGLVAEDGGLSPRLSGGPRITVEGTWHLGVSWAARGNAYLLCCESGCMVYEWDRGGEVYVVGDSGVI